MRRNIFFFFHTSCLFCSIIISREYHSNINILKSLYWPSTWHILECVLLPWLMMSTSSEMQTTVCRQKLSENVFPATAGNCFHWKGSVKPSVYYLPSTKKANWQSWYSEVFSKWRPKTKSKCELFTPRSVAPADRQEKIIFYVHQFMCVNILSHQFTSLCNHSTLHVPYLLTIAM